MKATKSQIKVLHAVLIRRGLMDMKPALVSDQSEGRTEHSSDLKYNEMKDLIDRLNKGYEIKTRTDKEASNKMRRRILSLCFNLGWTRYSIIRLKQEVDYARLHAWMMKYGYLHKAMNEYTYDELTKLVTQFESFTKTQLK
jgi:hypothetical protein